ncbi:hypothetical protein P8452_12902 [Trifolium repens]|jgi:hypothetical protein|nr:PII, uridylyltransferase [Trifolium repens]WJX23709.1 hypothetical protein P8452_12902 [Trifolium repens]
MQQRDPVSTICRLLPKGSGNLLVVSFAWLVALDLSMPKRSGVNSAFFPLSFKQLVLPTELWNYFVLTHPNYSYSKINPDGIVLEKNEPFSFTTVVKKSFLTFPKLEDETFQDSLSLISEDLTFHVSGFPDPMPHVQAPRVDIQMEILSVGPMFGRYWYAKNGPTEEQETPYHANAAEYT